MKKQEYIFKNYLNKELFEIVEDLNYSSIICKYNLEDYEKLKTVLENDKCSHMYILEYTKHNTLFYIENCDLQYICKYDKFYKTEYVLVNINFTDKGYILTEVKDYDE